MNGGLTGGVSGGVSAPVTARKAASLIVLRDSPRGPEVLLLRRADKPGDQNSGATVFPGGLIDAADAAFGGDGLGGLDDAAASALLGLAEGGLAFWAGALRECFEECGLLFATAPNGAFAALDSRDADELMTLRRALHRGEIDFAALCKQLGVTPAADALAYHSHWVTPLGMPKIFDTRFFIAIAPPGQSASHDATELVDLLWLTPAEAVDPARGLKLLNVTELTLKALGQFGSAGAALAAARAQTVVPRIQPRIARNASGRAVVNPADWAYAEVGRLDPAGRGDVRADLTPGEPRWLSPRVLRITADNGSMMTGPGTNSYFIGAGDDWALLDPGPDDAAHVRALLAQAPGRITRILATHTHKDHSPAAAAIFEATRAPRHGRVANFPEWQDESFVPEQVLTDGDRLALADGISLRVIHTPGHASNHLCYLLEQEKLLFTGDHLMQGSTVVINPPDGDMAQYLRSLERLLDEDIEWLAPGHGFLIDAPHAVVRKTIAHRLAREAKVVAGLAALTRCSEAELVATVYADTPLRLHAMALRSLRAHLDKLRFDGRVDVDAQGRWALQ